MVIHHGETSSRGPMVGPCSTKSRSLISPTSRCPITRKVVKPAARARWALRSPCSSFAGLVTCLRKTALATTLSWSELVVRCTCASIRPGRTVQPLASIRRVSAGTAASSAGPTYVMIPFWMTTRPFTWCVPGAAQTRPPSMAMSFTCSPSRW
ncbi:hypothetical protein ACFQV8_25665 [Pseudonocardia benzenivorans]